MVAAWRNSKLYPSGTCAMPRARTLRAGYHHVTHESVKSIRPETVCVHQMESSRVQPRMRPESHAPRALRNRVPTAQIMPSFPLSERGMLASAGVWQPHRTFSCVSFRPKPVQGLRRQRRPQPKCCNGCTWLLSMGILTRHAVSSFLVSWVELGDSSDFPSSNPPKL